MPGQHGQMPNMGPQGTLGMPAIPRSGMSAQHGGSAQYPSFPMPPAQGQAPTPYGQQPPRQQQQPLAQRPPSFGGTRVDVLDSARAIGTQIAVQTKGFVPFEQIQHDPTQLRVDYERLRLTWELTRDIGLERNLDQLLHKILMALFQVRETRTAASSCSASPTDSSPPAPRIVATAPKRPSRCLRRS